MSCLELRFVNFLLNEYCIVLYCLFAQTPMYNVNRIMRNDVQRGRARTAVKL